MICNVGLSKSFMESMEVLEQRSMYTLSTLVLIKDV